MHKSESVLKNETYEIPWDFQVQTDVLIPQPEKQTKC